MKYLITGATGLVGGQIVKHCHEKGISVNYLTTSRNKIISKNDYQGFYWNPDKREIDNACFEGVSVVLNLAGASISKRWTSDYKKKIISSRVNTLRTLYVSLLEIENHHIEAFVSASAIGIYPNSIQKYYNENTTEIDDSFLGNVVAQWESEIDKFNEFDFLVSKVRIGLVLSSKGGALPKMANAVKMYVGTVFGSGKQWQSWIHISDLANVFLFVAENKLAGVYNGVAPNPISQKKLIKEISQVLKRPLLLPNIPKLIIKALLGKMSYLLLASQRVSSTKIEKAGFIFQYQNCKVALTKIYGTIVMNKPGNSNLG